MNYKRKITIRLDRLLYAIGIFIVFNLTGLVLYVSLIHRFLSIHSPVRSRIMVVEGWIPDFALKIALDTFRREGYSMLLTTGGVYSEHSSLLDFSNAAEASKASLVKMGLEADSIQAVPMPRVPQNKTYFSAKCVLKYLESMKVSDRSLNIVSYGPHARRTRLLYRRAFGRNWNIGVINAVWDKQNGLYWYRSLEGFRTEIDQTIVWIYAKFLFKDKWTQNE